MDIHKRAVRALLKRTAGTRGPDRITRHAMYTRLRDTVPRPDGRARVLSISGSSKLVERLDLATGEVVEADYPKHDLLHLQFADDSFDYLVADQVLEHIEGDPFRAAAESLRVVRPGAFVVHTTCFINPIHGAPNDYWRFTPHALRLLFADADIVEVGGWGNRTIWRYMELGLRYQRVPKATWHPLHRAAIRNDPEWPIVTWIVARKP